MIIFTTNGINVYGCQSEQKDSELSQPLTCSECEKDCPIKLAPIATLNQYDTGRQIRFLILLVDRAVQDQFFMIWHAERAKNPQVGAGEVAANLIEWAIRNRYESMGLESATTLNC